MEQEVTSLQSKGAIIPVTRNPREGFFSTLFLVPKKDGKMRPVINLKALNVFVKSQHFKMEGIHLIPDLMV